MLKEICFKARFDKAMVDYDALPSFGKYSIVKKDGEEVSFDFYNGEIAYLNEDGSEMYVRQYGLDKLAYPESTSLLMSEFLDTSSFFSEIFCYVGEEEDCPRLVLVEDMCLTFESGDVVKVSSEKIYAFFGCRVGC